MVRHRAPLWLAQPSRFRGMDRVKARIWLAILAVVFLACLTAIGVPGTPSSTGSATSQTDVVLYQTIVDRIRHGEPYYDAAVELHRAGGYPLKPFFTVRMPTLAVVEAVMPIWTVRLLLWMLCIGTLLAWIGRLGPVAPRWPARALAGAMLIACMIVNVQPGLEVFHEIWAGPLIALSLALRRPGEWTAAVAIGLSAMLIRETALLFVAIMAVTALIDGQRREAIAWVSTIAVFGLALAAHAYAVAQVVEPLDAPSTGWIGFLGLGFFIRLATISTALSMTWQWLASIILGFGLFGWTAWRDPTATRVAAVIAGYALLIAIGARSDNIYWVLMITPLLLVGLTFVPDGLRDLLDAARDTRRITVRRVVR